MNGRRANAFLAGIAADIAVFAAIAQDDNRFARQRRLGRKLNALSIGVVESRFSAGVKLVNNAKQLGFVGGVIDKNLKGRVKNSERNRVIGAQCANITSSGLPGLFQWQTIHAAAGVDHQHAGKCQVVIGDIFYSADAGNAGQITADLKIVRLQPGNKLPTGIQYADIDGGGGQVGRIHANNIHRHAGFVLR